ncbi:prepilin-type N-terminal cleavage/methylation domain-containing protein [Paenibacillus camerounensis]|uniref:prepilin-type N-terminal cleavage/methylation domain-containing protein n=1 Tax=Paenibacillus camerounensis TaxID=1243663 RepID=UPI0005A9D9D7|nr:prepilin-type N-terminal cleavage/methylation domain-containing protein [Paenibacillus camerounensis]
MKRFVKLLRREQGLTLIELIAGIALFSMVAGLIYGVMLFGIRSYNQVSVENKLRDEGDLLMSAIITEMYTFGPTVVSATGKALTLSTIKDDGSQITEQISIADGKMKFNGISDIRTDITADLVEDSGFTLTCSTGAPCESGLIQIKLNLHKDYGGKPFELSLESTFGF